MLALSLVLHHANEGLKLQEASCHTVEATRVVDDVFQDIFVHEGKWPLVSLNQHTGNVLHLCYSLVLNTYSDAKNTWWLGSTGKLAKDSPVFKDRKFDSRKEDTPPVTIDLTKQEVAKTIEASPATLPKEASFDNLLSHDDVQTQNFPKTSTAQDQEQPSRVATAKRRRSGSLPSLSESVWSQESLKVDESFNTSILLTLVIFSAADEGVDDLGEGFNLGGLPALDVCRP